jgi:DNA-directed RNA polymerase subunit F
MDPKAAKKIKQQLVKECEITEEEAAELVNIRPTTLAELRSFTFGWKKLILAETLEKMLKILKENS